MVLGTCGIAARHEAQTANGTHLTAPRILVAPSVDSKTISIKGQSSLDKQSKFHRISPPFRSLASFQPPLPPLLPSVLTRITVEITSATPPPSRGYARDVITLSRVSELDDASFRNNRPSRVSPSQKWLESDSHIVSKFFHRWEDESRLAPTFWRAFARIPFTSDSCTERSEIGSTYAWGTFRTYLVFPSRVKRRQHEIFSTNILIEQPQSMLICRVCRDKLCDPMSDRRIRTLSASNKLRGSLLVSKRVPRMIAQADATCAAEMDCYQCALCVWTWTSRVCSSNIRCMRVMLGAWAARTAGQRVKRNNGGWPSHRLVLYTPELKCSLIIRRE